MSDKYDQCPKCKAYAVHLATATVVAFWGDQDDNEGNPSDYADEVVEPNDDISLFIHACFKCGHLADVGIEMPREKVINTREEPDEPAE